MFRPPPIKIDTTISSVEPQSLPPLPHEISNSSERPGSPIMSESEYYKNLRELTNLRNKQYRMVKLAKSPTSKEKQNNKEVKRLNQFNFADQYVTSNKDRIKLEEWLLEADDMGRGRRRLPIRKSKKTRSKKTRSKKPRSKKSKQRKNTKRKRLKRGRSKTRRR
jgi:hypothetical protein